MSKGPIGQVLGEQGGEEFAARSEFAAAELAGGWEGCQQANGERLGEQGGGQVRGALQAREAADDRLGGAYPTDAESGPKQFAERTDGDDGGLGIEGGDRWGRRAIENQLGECAVVDEGDAEFGGNARGLFAGGTGHHGAGGVLVSGSEVDQPGGGGGDAVDRKSVV